MATSIPSPFAQYYGVIASASAERVSAADLWALINAYEEQEGIVRPAGLFGAVNQMRSIAVASRNAGEKLTAANDSDAIDSSMIAQAINSRDITQQQLAPAYTIRYQATVLTSEGEDTVWRSIIQRGSLPATKGALVDLVIGQFLDDSATYGEIATGLTGNINISAV